MQPHLHLCTNASVLRPTALSWIESLIKCSESEAAQQAEPPLGAARSSVPLDNTEKKQQEFAKLLSKG